MTNLLANSDFELDFGGLTEAEGASWEANPADGRTRVEGDAAFGSWYCVLANTDDRPSPNIQSESTLYNGVTEGDPITASMYVRNGAGSGWTVRLDVQFFDATDTPVSGTAQLGTPMTPDANWQRVVTTGAIVPAGAHHAQVRIVMVGSELGDEMHLDGVQLEVGTTETAYAPNPAEADPIEEPPTVDQVFLTGQYEDVTGKPWSGFVIIKPSDASLVNDTQDLVIAGEGRIPLTEGGFRVSLPVAEDPELDPATFEYTVIAVRAGNPRTELAPVTFTLRLADATAITEDDGEGGTVTFYEKDISDFMTA
jgi:hypothetical protein